MLNLVSGLAVVGLTGWLLVTGWVSSSRFGWQYNVWAMVIVLLWAQPWSRTDPYRTGRRFVRWIFYAILLVSSFGIWYVLSGLWPVLVALEVILLFVLEYTGRPTISED